MLSKARAKLGKVKLYSTRLKPRSRGTPRQIAALRMNDINRLFRARYGHFLPDDDAGRDDIMVAVNHLASLRPPLKRIDDWLKLWCPWITVRERDKIAAEAILHQEHWTADQLAWRLRLTDADRTALAITTIGAIDCNKKQRRLRRKANAKARAQAWRDAQKQPRTHHKTTIAAYEMPDNDNETTS